MQVQAQWWEPLENKRVRCTLCPRFCQPGDGQTGFCFIRKNEGGKLYQNGFGSTTGLAVDPVEKKPLYHFLPGTSVLSFGTVGCNLGCRFCQNWDISKARLGETRNLEVSPREVVKMAQKGDCPSIAYTYNDPTIFAEFVVAVAQTARRQGIKNVMVTNGYITPQAREEVYAWIDAANVDLKAFTERFYRKLTLSHLEPVLDTLRWLVHETDVWVEITTLIIPGENDTPEELDQLTRFVAQELGPQIPLHFSAFHPDFKLLDHTPTPLVTLQKARAIGLENGLQYVYLGNVPTAEGQNTCCPGCHRRLIERQFYHVEPPRLNGDRCPHCGHTIAGHFA